MLPYLRVVTWATAAIFFGVAVLVAIAFPLHASDALTFGEWSRLIAQHWHHVLDPSTRPLFYVLQGSLWHVAGYSDTSGRLLCGLFSVILVVSLKLVPDALVGVPSYIIAAVAFLATVWRKIDVAVVAIAAMVGGVPAVTRR